MALKVAKIDNGLGPVLFTALLPSYARVKPSVKQWSIVSV